MKKIINSLLTPTGKKSLFYYVGNFILNIGRYLFHLILLRYLNPSSYGEFLSYLSLTYILSIPMSTVSNIIVKYISGFQGKNDKSSTNHFFYYILGKIMPITCLIGILVISFSTPLSNIFKANPKAFVVLGISVFINLFQTIFTSYLIALQKFISQTIYGFISILLSILISIIFIKLGFGATGAVIGQLLAAIIIILLVFIEIKKFIYPSVKGKEKFNVNIKKYTGFSFLYSIGVLSMISVDILVVRYLFDPFTSGLYSSLSILGRMIYYGLSPIAALALPLVSHKYTSGGNAKQIFYKLGGVMLLFGIIGAGIFSLFPGLIIQTLSGKEYLAAAPYLSVFSVTMVLLALNQFVITYLMATDRASVNHGFIVFAIIQPLAIYLFKSSLNYVIWSNLAVQVLLLLYIIIYTKINQQSKISTKV